VTVVTLLVFFTNNTRLLKIERQGTLSIFAGSVVFGFAGDWRAGGRRLIG
jgi:hypothetical protein